VPTKAHKTWAQQLQQNHAVTIGMSCCIVGLSRCAYELYLNLEDIENMENLFYSSDTHLLKWIPMSR
jgi:hypothetical protein